MKEFIKHNKLRFACVVIAAILILVGSILSIIQKEKGDPLSTTEPETETTAPATQPTQPTTLEPDAETEISCAEIEGMWFSSSGDVMTIRTDGTYTSANLGNGTYTLAQGQLTMTTYNGKPLIMDLVISEEYRLLLGDDTYYRTAEKASAPADDVTGDEPNADAAREALLTLLTNGKWSDTIGETTLEATDTTITVTYSGGVTGGESSSCIITYTLSDVTYKERNNDSVYEATITCTRDAYGGEYTVPSKLQLFVGAEKYTLASEVFPYARTFYRSILTEPDAPPEETEPESSSYQSLANFDPVTQEMLVGTWIGEIDGKTQQFIFNADGTYTFESGSYKETGTFTVSEYDNGLFHSALHLTTGGKEKTIDFYLRTEGRFLVLDADHPVYERKGDTENG